MSEASDVQQILIADIQPWDRNPRSARHSAAEDANLQASIAQDGVLQSLVVRPHAVGGGFLLVCGERRYHAAKAAGLSSVPAAIRTLTDAEALAIALQENLQRRDMHPLDEAAGMADLQKADPALRTPAALGARLGVPESHVRRRLKLGALIAPARAAFLANALTAQQAESLARLPKDLQQKALEEACYYELFGSELRNALTGVGEAWALLRDHVAPIATLREWLQDHVVADPRDAEVQDAIPELAGFVKAADDAGRTILGVSEATYNLPPHVVSANDYRIVPLKGANKKCASTERAVVVHAGPTRLIDICRDKSCAKHWPGAAQQARDDAHDAASGGSARRVDPKAEQRRKTELAWQKTKRAAMPALVKAVVAHAKLSAALVLATLGKYDVQNVKDRTGVTLTDATAAAVLALHAIARSPMQSKADLVRAGKPYKFDVGAWERMQKAAAKAAKTIHAIHPKNGPAKRKAKR